MHDAKRPCSSQHPNRWITYLNVLRSQHLTDESDIVQRVALATAQSGIGQRVTLATDESGIGQRVTLATDQSNIKTLVEESYWPQMRVALVGQSVHRYERQWLTTEHQMHER